MADYLKILTEDIHSAAIATLDARHLFYGISRNASTKAITDKIAVIVIVLVLNLALFADLISVVIILL